MKILMKIGMFFPELFVMDTSKHMPKTIQKKLQISSSHTKTTGH
jgi:hypothetical protein